MTLYTAAQIAAALGITRQSAQGRLANVEPCGKTIAGGNPAAAWTFTALPETLRNDLLDVAKRRGYRDVSALLAALDKPWQPCVPLNQCAPSAVQKAAQLCRAFAPTIERRKTISGAELERLGLEDYRREFGFKITSRHWRRLLDSIVWRDCGMENWARLEVYLGEAPARKAPDEITAAEIEFTALHQLLVGFQNPATPTDEEQRLLWIHALELYESLCAMGKPPKKCKRRIVEFLWRHASALAKTLRGLEVQFLRKHRAWLDGGAQALTDRRTTPSAPVFTLSEADRDTIIWHAVFNCGGRISQAWRELARTNSLSEDLLSRLLLTPKCKSYVPRFVRDAVKHEVAALEDIHHGPRQHRLNGAHISRDYTSIFAADWWQGDDFTMPIYYYVPDGQGWFNLTRGQILLMMDFRSARILGYVMIPARNYTARAIRTLIVRCADTHGLPRKGFYFEKGIWKSSKLLKGDQLTCALSDEQAELGLRDFGLRFVHANLPRAKIIERIGGILQDMMEGVPGYCGRNEQTEKFERVQRAKLDVDAKRVHPSRHFLSESQWDTQFNEILERYNNEPQQGKILRGMSPELAYAELADINDPPQVMDASCRYLLAHHLRPVTVGKNGITIRNGKDMFVYRDAQTARLIGQRVLSWFNPEIPDVLTVTDLQRQNPFTVGLRPEIPALDAPEEILTAELANIDEHTRYHKERYRVLQTKFARPLRRNLVDESTVELGRTITAQQSSVLKDRDTTRSQVRRIKQAAESLGVVMPETLRNPDRILDGMEWEKEIRAQLAAEKSKGQD